MRWKRQDGAPTLWSAARRQVAAGAFGVAALTGFSAHVIGDETYQSALAGLYVLLAAIAIFNPEALTWKLVLGAVLVGIGMIDHEGTEMLVMLPVLGGVVATAELLGITARLGMVIERDPAPDLVRLCLVVVLTLASYAAVLLTGELDGPSGLVSTGLAAGACVGLALALRRPDDQKPSGALHG